MWNYEKRLQYPVDIRISDPKIAQYIMSQYGGPDGEIGASMRYLSQRFTMPNRMAAAVLNDIGKSVINIRSFYIEYKKMCGWRMETDPFLKAFLISIYRALYRKKQITRLQLEKLLKIESRKRED